MKARPRRSSVTKSPRRMKSARYSKSSRSFTGAGLHNRRDKRFPMFKQRIVADDSDKTDSDTATDAEEVDHVAFGAEPWRKAVMLWLSWNRTHERLTAKMSRADQSPEKLAALRDEMESLRARAIDLSEKLIQAV